MMHIYVDIDGTLADFASMYRKMAGPVTDWPKGEYNLAKVFEHYIDPVDLPAIAWAEMNATLDACDILATLWPYNWSLTTRVVSLASAVGKSWWASSHYPTRQLWMVDGLKASQLPAHGNVLIDDSDAEIQAWVAAGGRGVLIPRQWNSGTGTVQEALCTL